MYIYSRVELRSTVDSQHRARENASHWSRTISSSYHLAETSMQMSDETCRIEKSFEWKQIRGENDRGGGKSVPTQLDPGR